MKRLLSTLALVCALSVSVLAGDPEQPPAPQPPPTAETTSVVTEPTLLDVLWLLITLN